MKYLFYLTFFLFSFGQLGRISFFDQQINIYLYEGLVLLVGLVLLLRYGLQPIKDSLKKFWLVHLFLLFLFLSFLFGARNFKHFENFVGLLYLLRLLLYFGYFFYLWHLVKRQPQFGKIVMKGLLIFIVLTAISSILQYFLYPDLRNLLYAGWDPHLYRAFGTFFDTSTAGGLYGLIFLFLFLTGNYLIKNKFSLIFLTAIFLIFIILTFSRSLYITFLIICVWYAVVKRWYKGFLIFIGLYLLLLIIVPKPFGEGVNLVRMFSVKSRIEDYRSAIKIWSKKPILGIGYNRIRYAKPQMNISEELGYDVTHSGASFHSSLLTVLVAGGIVGLGLFLGVLYQLLQLNRIAGYYLVFLVLLSLTDNILLHPFILFLFLSLTSVSLVIPSRK